MNQRRIYIVFCLFLNSFFVFSEKLNAQEKTSETLSIEITGAVQKPIVITWDSLDRCAKKMLPEFIVKSHNGEFRKRYNSLKVVPLLALIRSLNFNNKSPKELSEYFLIARASDNYAVVISWNELFNTPNGQNFFIVVEADGKSLKGTSESFLLIATGDTMTGRRHVKSLKSIEIKRI